MLVSAQLKRNEIIHSYTIYMKSKKVQKYYVPYKTYLFGLIKIKDGWKDMGLSGSFSVGEKRKYSYSVYGNFYSGEEEITRNMICRTCRVILRLMLLKKTNKIYFYCPNCGIVYTVKYKK